ncbi:MAG: NAD-dependent epimerase/dehydratase family protein [Bacteroidota bacterium]|nr:NAD-dependent epimerase/dehydratase family protein [Bacteroidota bacterium]
MKILVLGGTLFVGRHIVEALLAAGHTVSIFNRGKSPVEFPEFVERLNGDRDEGMQGLKILTDHTWDVCVDVSGFTPQQVRPSAEKLHGCVGRYIFVSAVSVYGDPVHGPVYETHSRIPPANEDVTEINSETYGALKVTCENIIREIYADKCTLIRPQIVAGPHDPFDRFSYWVRRATLGNEMLAPGDGSDFLQVIDARDVAQFTRTLIENDIGGSFNLSGPRLTWKEFMKVLGAENIVWVSAEIIKSAGLTQTELPLYRQNASARSSLMNVSSEKAVSAGLKLTDIEVTIKDTKNWLHDSSILPALSPEIEKNLISIAKNQ